MVSEVYEGRGQLRKVMGRSKHPLIHECPNGETFFDDKSKSLKIKDLAKAKEIVLRRQPGEVKHLSTRRKRKRM